MAEETQKIQVLDAAGLNKYTNALKDGTLVVGKAGKAGEADTAPWDGVSGKPKTFPAEAHTHTAAECGYEAIPDATIEAIISGTYAG
ncbi:MAG: hypothetical protein NC131_21635 [Roseburia sp.]|nr:hypothetical protein [Roseburia sp.]